MNTHASKSDLCRAMFAGALAGLIGSVAMTRFHVALSGRGETGSENPQSNKPVDGERDDAAMETAEVVTRTTTGRELEREEKTEVGGPLAHYAFGAFAGAIYGVINEVAPNSAFTHGLPFGAALWVTADQLALPLVGLSPWPLKAYPYMTNVQHLASHFVFGTTMAQAYGGVRKAI